MAATSAAPAPQFLGGVAHGVEGGVGIASTRGGIAPTVGQPTPPHPITNGVRGGLGLVLALLEDMTSWEVLALWEDMDLWEDLDLWEDMDL